MRTDVRFTTGHALTAEDVAFSACASPEFSDLKSVALSAFVPDHRRKSQLRARSF